MSGEIIFYCKYPECEYSSVSFNWVLKHTWERHSIKVRVLNTNVTFQAVQGSMLIYKVLGGTLKITIVGFMIVLSGVMREKIITV